MSKRTVKRLTNAVDTPSEAIEPLLAHLPRRFTYAEPCAGRGALVDGLAALHAGAECVLESDIRPRGPKERRARIARLNALWTSGTSPGLREHHVARADLIVTNPPWARALLHPLILRFALLRPSWLLFEADWAHTKQAEFYLRLCRKVVSVGRVSWMANGKAGFENAAWYLFDGTPGLSGGPVFIGRTSP